MKKITTGNVLFFIFAYVSMVFSGIACRQAQREQEVVPPAGRVLPAWVIDARLPAAPAENQTNAGNTIINTVRRAYGRQEPVYRDCAVVTDIYGKNTEAWINEKGLKISFEREHGHGWTTNIVLPDDYQGTIRVRGNYFSLTNLPMSEAAELETNIQWYTSLTTNLEPGTFDGPYQELAGATGARKDRLHIAAVYGDYVPYRDLKIIRFTEVFSNHYSLTAVFDVDHRVQLSGKKEVVEP